MTRPPANAGRNCAYLPIARGRLDSMLRRSAGKGAMVFRVPRSYYIGDFLWKMFFLYALIGMIAFAAGMLYFNNTTADFGALAQRPEAPWAAGAVLLVVSAPVLIGLIRNSRRGLPCVYLDRRTRNVTFGRVRRRSWVHIDYEYGFDQLHEVEVLRNYESRWNARRTTTRQVDSYELNLRFHPDDHWIGITESLDRQAMKSQAARIARMCGARLVERNVTELDGVSASMSRRSGTADSGPAAHDSHSGSVPTGPPPFLSGSDVEVFHTLPVLQGKLRLKLFPFHFRVTDQIGQSMASLLSPVVSHMVNKLPLRKSASALRYLCSDRDTDGTARAGLVTGLHESGWHGEREVHDLLVHVFDAQSAPVPGGNASRDLFERYYIRLADQVRNLAWKYRIVFLEHLERVCADAARRFDTYARQPGKLTGIQQSEAYAFRFIVGVAAVVICGATGAFSWLALRAGIRWGEPQVIVGGSIGAAVTLALALLARKLRRRMGGRVRD